jgi:glucan phosphoethanolaminetransferase (alkaline phosphatase superfamily)
MTEHASRSPAVHAATRTRAGVSVGERLLALVTAGLLGVDAYVHLHDAAKYDGFKSSVMTEGDLFRIQAVVAIVVGVLVLIWPRIITWLLSLLVAGSAAVAVTLYTYVNVGELGPLPNLYENTWHQPGKIASAIAEAVAALLSIVGLLLAARTRRRRRG